MSGTLTLLANTARLVGSGHSTINSSASNVTAMTTVTRTTRVSPTDLNMALVPPARDLLRAFIDKLAQMGTARPYPAAMNTHKKTPKVRDLWTCTLLAHGSGNA